MNELGCSTFCLMDLPLEDALLQISALTGTIEVLSDGPHDLFTSYEACFSFDVRYTVHAPCSEINLASVYEPIRASGIGVIAELCGICDEIGAGTLVVHPGYFSWDATRALSERALLKSLDDLSLVQQEHGVRIGVENMGGWECCHFREPGFLEQVTWRGLGFVLDIGHAHLNGVLAPFLLQGEPCHVHLHDNAGVSDDHAACGTGSIDFRAVMDQLPPDAGRVVEVRDIRAFQESLAYLSTVSGSPVRKGPSGCTSFLLREDHHDREDHV